MRRLAMISDAIRLMAFALLLAPLARAGDAPAAASPDFELDEVLVVGERPGPAMWKVTRGEHTLWIMGTLSPLPAGMTWRSAQAQAVIRRSGEILAGSLQEARFASNWTALRHLRGLMRLRYNADGSTLREALPADVYARWHAAHRRWFGEDPDPKEKARPLYAAELLHQQALKRSGLSTQPVVWNSVRRLAREHDVRIRQRKFSVELDDPKQLIADIAALPRAGEVACLVATLDYIDTQLPEIKQRAQAWAIGDLATLRALPRRDARQSCFESVIESSRLRDIAREQEAAIRDDWSGIVDWMLLTHETSFTTLPVQQLLEEGGVLDRLRERGYGVEEP